MGSDFRYDNAVEERLHQYAIQRLAQDLSQQEEDVRELYEAILGGIKQGASVKEYLVILVSRQVKGIIQSRAQKPELTTPVQVHA